MLQNVTGQEVNYDLFKTQFDNDPQLSSLIDRFDSRGITIKSQDSAGTSQTTQGGQGSSTVNLSAKRAASATLARVG